LCFRTAVNIITDAHCACVSPGANLMIDPQNAKKLYILVHVLHQNQMPTLLQMHTC